MSQTTAAFDPAARWAAPSGEPLVTDDLRALLRQAFALEEGGGPVASPAAVALPVGPSALAGA
ncbi:MAG: FAD-binding oxidoreductase, partial [Conexibacter sp.]|nr:FAD-binding oxidoreductase [Conexibacter sp.]